MSALLASLAWALLDFVWQGLLIGWGAALGFALLRKARPQTRYAFGCAALLLCLALPLAGTLQRVLAAQASTTSLPLHFAIGQAVADAHAGPVLLVAGHLSSWEQTLQAQLPLVMLFWSCGAGLLALRMVLGLAWVRRRSQPGQFATDAAWQARLDRLALRMGIARQVVLGLVDDLASPVTAGWWRPVVLVPASLLSGMPHDLLEALLAHELAHIRRHDYLINLIQSAIEIVLFYHPTVWWLSSRIRVEREQIADDLAASMLGEPRRLALALSELDQFQFATPQLAHGAHGGNLMSRIKRLVRPDTEPLNWKMALPILGLAAACAAFYANAQVAPAPGTPTAAPRPGVNAPAPKPVLQRLSLRGGRKDMAYALVSGEERSGVMMSGSSDNWRDIAELKRTVKGDFLWYRKDGKSYVVQDPALIARLNAAHAPMKKLSAEMEVYSKEMEQAGKGMEKLSADMARLSAVPEPEHARLRETERTMHALGREQDKIGRAMDKLGRRMDKASTSSERDTLSREMDGLSRQMDALSRQMDAESDSMRAFHERMEKASAPMEAIGKQMEEAGKPMEAVGKKMDALGKVMEAEGEVMERAVREAIDEAQARGLGMPVK
jgi:beta-lactamase regulating signal transducer with metallopeptidase domain/predicted  nucleic acid-binding Zn-ribbon protein